MQERFVKSEIISKHYVSFLHVENPLLENRI